MESAWQQLLNRLSSADPEFTYDDVCGWGAEEFEALSGAGLISEMTQATHVACDACEDQHWERVRWSEDGEQAFIPCSVAGTTVNVDLERLRRWRIDVVHLAAVLAEALELRSESTPLAVGGGLWRLGCRRFDGQFRDFFFTVTPEEELPAAIRSADKALVSGTGLLILPLQREIGAAGEPAQLKVVAISDIASWKEGKLALDIDLIEDVFTRDHAAGRVQSVRSLPIPDNATWDELLIQVLDTALRIEVGSYKVDVSFDEAGFGERDKRLETLKLLASGRGRLATERVSGAQQDKTPMKNRIYQLRRFLQTLIRIDGNPIAYRKTAGLYESKFRVCLAVDSSFPTPPGVSWLHFRFVERRDGRLAVTVAEKKVFRAHQVESGSNRRTEEVAQREEAVTRLFSFEELSLKNNRGKLTPEGTVLIELLRGEGKLERRGDDMAVLKFAEWLREWTGLGGDPLQYTGRNRMWSAYFECAMEQQG